VFLNSHLLGEVEATCDRVSFIKAGRVLRTLALQEIAEGQIHVELRVDAITPALLAALEQTIGDCGRVVVNGHAPGDSIAPATCQLTLTDEQLLPLIAERTLASGARLYALTPRRMSLEQLFLEVVGSEDSGQ
jgi:ABC-2 type transport system ATP-binding protein